MVFGNLKEVRIILVAGLAFASSLAGCSHLKVTRYSNEKLQPTQSVEVFHKFPDRPHVEIARFSVRNARFRDEEGILIREAQKVGADGIVFLTENAGVPIRDQVAVGIKWK